VRTVDPPDPAFRTTLSVGMDQDSTLKM
jgi:hypothetical protein